jgi:3',5'-cyclic AMP phosphodiesterase CpdA
MRKFPARLFPVTLVLLALVFGGEALTGQQRQQAAAPALGVLPPVNNDSVKFLVIGDSGTGDRAQIETAQMMWKVRSVFPYTFAIMLGDNMYGSERPQDYARKFEAPFKPLLDAKIDFHAALGNHDDPNQMYYKPFGMGGKRFYTYEKKDARFFVLDSNYMDRDQQRWLEQELSQSKAKWKIAYFHHPIYSSGGRHGSEVDLRGIIEPLFIKYALNVVFSGHEHFYERLKPQKGINYFTAGGSAKLRAGDINVGAMTAKGFDTDQSFMLVEIDGDAMHFQTISRRGRLIDSGTVTRQNTGGTS